MVKPHDWDMTTTPQDPETTTGATPQPYTKDQAKAHDAAVAEALKAESAAASGVDAAEYTAHQVAGDRRVTKGRREQVWTMSLADVKVALQAKAETDGGAAAARALEELAAKQAAYREARGVVNDLETVWREHGRWSRFYLVPGGHIHSSTGCHTLRLRTRVGWLPELSGETEAEAVATQGPLLCSICFESAPLEWTVGVQKPVNPKECPGSKKYVPNVNLRRYSPRGECPECGQWVSVTKLSKARVHDRPEAPDPDTTTAEGAEQ